MPSRDEIMEIRSESFADDVPIIDGMESWTEDQIRDYFDSGGTDAPSNWLQLRPAASQSHFPTMYTGATPASSVHAPLRA